MFDLSVFSPPAPGLGDTAAPSVLPILNANIKNHTPIIQRVDVSITL